MSNVPGAQTERRSDAGPVRSLLGGKASPAAFVFDSIDRSPCPLVARLHEALLPLLLLGQVVIASTTVAGFVRRLASITEVGRPQARQRHNHYEQPTCTHGVSKPGAFIGIVAHHFPFITSLFRS